MIKEIKSLWNKVDSWIKIIIGIISALFGIILFPYVIIFRFGISHDNGDWGTFGDYFGGVLNPTLGFMSFIALLYTINLQNKQLKKTDEQLEQNRIALDQNAEALKLNNQELQNSNEQLSLSAKAQTEMEKTQRLQQFEGLFTYMANEISKIYENIRKDTSISQLYHEILLSNWDKEKIIEQIRQNYNLTRFFIFLYQILRYISESNLKEEEQKKYSNLIRSSIETPILQLLLINSIEYSQYRILLNKFSFFEHMSFIGSRGHYAYNLIYAINFHDRQAFDESIYYAKLQDSSLLMEISTNKKNSNYKVLFNQLINQKIGTSYTKTIEDVEFAGVNSMETIKIQFKKNEFLLKIAPKLNIQNNENSQANDILAVQKLLQSNALLRTVEYSKVEFLNLNDDEIVFLVDRIEKYNIFLIFDNKKDLRVFVIPNNIGLNLEQKENYELFFSI